MASHGIQVEAGHKSMRKAETCWRLVHEVPPGVKGPDDQRIGQSQGADGLAADEQYAILQRGREGVATGSAVEKSGMLGNQADGKLYMLPTGTYTSAWAARHALHCEMRRMLMQQVACMWQAKSGRS